MKHPRTIFVLFVLLGLLAALAAPVLAAPGDTTLVSLADDETQGNEMSAFPDLTPDGRYVAFIATASNLVAGDTNGVADVFVRDRSAGTTTRVSVATDGTQADGSSYSIGVSISSDGRFVAFDSNATNLVAADTNGESDVFVRDRDTDEDSIFDEPGHVATILASINLGGTDSGNSYSYNPSLSADGRYVAFDSDSSDLVAGGDTNTDSDAFLRDLTTGATVRVSVDSSEAEANGGSYDPKISADGLYVAFHSYADNLVAGDANLRGDVFVRDLIAGETYLVSVATDGTQGNDGSSYQVISADGRYVAFGSGSTNFVTGDTNAQWDIFVRDRTLGTTTCVSVASDGTLGNSWSDHIAISPDGRYVAFESFATNLVTDDTNGKWDVFLHDQTTGITQRISVDSSGAQANNSSFGPSLSSNASFAAFHSEATNLVAGDTNDEYDVFLREPNFPPTNITLSASSVTENLPAGTTVGTLTTTDPNATDTHTYSFECTTPGVDDASFQIGGAGNDELQTAAVFDYETKNAYNICIRTDDGNGGTFDKNFTITVTDVNETLTATFRSVGTYDGWTLELMETSNTGAWLNVSGATFNLGDETWNRQYRAILHFNTSSLPNNAVITKVTLKIRKQGLVGTDPFTILGGLKVDMRKPFFGANAGLVIGDFQAAAGKSAVATFGATPVGNWYSALLNATGRAYVNKTGTTQFRLRFATDDNNDNGADYMKFYSGNYATVSARPMLVIEYYLPIP